MTTLTCNRLIPNTQCRENQRTTLKKILNVLSVWQQRSITRQQLKHLSAEQLDDIGISRKEALNESNKPFWHE